MTPRFLWQELEVRRNHRLCVHERDFQVGVDISENIVTSITRSARVIIVVSNEYINSSWCQYEVQIALTEMHEKRKRQFLIPVLLHQVTISFCVCVCVCVLDFRVNQTLENF